MKNFKIINEGMHLTNIEAKNLEKAYKELSKWCDYHSFNINNYKLEEIK